MLHDAQGLPVTAPSEAAVQAYDHAIDGYLRYRADGARRLAALLETAPDFALAHCLKGYFLMLSYRQDTLQAARDAAATAHRLVTGHTRREQAHVAALQAWTAGEPDRAAALWQHILDEHPHDILAFRLAHFVNFWLGRPETMLASVLGVEKHWSAALPGYTAILACRCFAHEECGYYTEAEAAGRAAIARDPGDLWAAHGVAHVMEMQGRRGEGITWLDALAPHWVEGNNLRHHLWWHAAMFHMERGDTARVLALYDDAFRDLHSPLTEAMPDLYIDVQNAASMLFRLGRHGVEVGERWVELADKAEARIGDCQSAFTLPHWMMALAATGRDAAAQAMLSAMRDFARAEQPIARLVAEVALPVTEAVLANLQGRHAAAVALMRPVVGEMDRMGGSHAQQDVLEQVFLDSALKAGANSDAAMMMQRAAGRHPVPPARRRGYAMGVRLLSQAGIDGSLA
jgi:tetratricopeptide (TPR) repeat protein